jgi:hypothetical protein
LSAPHDVLAEYMDPGSDQVRHFKWIQVIGWGGDLVLSIVLHLSRLGTKLHVEADYYLLTPLRPEFYAADRLLARRQTARLLRQFGDVPGVAFLLTAALPVIILGKILRPLRASIRDKAIRQQIARDPFFDYGTAVSIRNWVSSTEYRHYFQRVDKERFVKVLERQILDAIIDFLNAKGIDTSDVKERKTTILNSGVIMSGGSIESQNLAVGPSATAKSRGRSRTRREGVEAHGA